MAKNESTDEQVRLKVNGAFRIKGRGFALTAVANTREEQRAPYEKTEAKLVCADWESDWCTPSGIEMFTPHRPPAEIDLPANIGFLLRGVVLSEQHFDAINAGEPAEVVFQSGEG